MGEQSKQEVQLKGPLRQLHYGPGPHPGTGTDQDVHGNGDGGGDDDYEGFSKEEWPKIGDKASVLTNDLLTYHREIDDDWVNVEVTWIDDEPDKHGNHWVTVELLSGPLVGEEDDVALRDWLMDAQELDEDLVPSADPEERAIEIFGLTNNYWEAGYIMGDGEMLDFSGKRQGGSGGTRALDHRDIWQAFEGTEEELGGTDAMVKFMALGNIRMGFYGQPPDASFDIAKLPTSAQKRTMREMAEVAEDLRWDITDPETGYTVASGSGYPEDELDEMFDQAVRKLTGKSVGYFTLTFKHYGPGPHPSGSSQDVHGKKGYPEYHGKGSSIPTLDRLRHGWKNLRRFEFDPEKFDEIVDQIEQSIRNQKLEYFYILGKDGVGFAKAGEERRVSFTDAEVREMKRMESSVSIHNHPGTDDNNDKEIDPPSLNDILASKNFEVGQFRVVTESRVYIIDILESGSFGMFTRLAIKNAWHDYYKDNIERFIPDFFTTDEDGNKVAPTEAEQQWRYATDTSYASRVDKFHYDRYIYVMEQLPVAAQYFSISEQELN